MKYKIAIASSDGKVVNQHFGRARFFYIGELESSNAEFTYIEQRLTSSICQGQYHDDSDLERLANCLADCDYVLVSRIGSGARAALKKYHTEVFELPEVITESLKRLCSYIEVQKLFGEVGQK